MLPAVTGLALGCSLAYWLVPRRSTTVGSAPNRPIVLPTGDDLEDELIVELVKSEIARVCSRYDAIGVTCANGVLRLDGSVANADLPRILRCLGRIPGIREIHDHLARYQQQPPSQPQRQPSRQPQIVLMHAE